jgi:hypothetical protein
LDKSIGDRWRSARRRHDDADEGEAERPARKPTSHKPPTRKANAAQTVAALRTDAPVAARWVVDTNHGHLNGRPDTYTLRHTGTGETHPYGTDREGAHLRAQRLNKAAEPHVCMQATVDHLAAQREACLARAAEHLAKRTELEAQRARLYEECEALWNAEHAELRQADDYRHLISASRYGIPAAQQWHTVAQPDGLRADGEAADADRPDADELAAADAAWHKAHPDERCPNFATCRQCADPMPAAVAQNAKAAFAAAKVPDDECCEWAAEHGRPCEQCATAAVADLPEQLTAAPQGTGPATVPQLQPRRDGERTLPLPVNDFLTAADGMARRTTPDPTNGEADTITLQRPNGAKR